MNFNYTTDMAFVRNMYTGLEVITLNPSQKTTRRRNQLAENPHVLFRIRRLLQLHILQFNPADYVDQWVREIKNRNYTQKITLHVIIKDLHQNPHRTTIQLSGNLGELTLFCEGFPELRQLVLHAQAQEE